MNYRHAYHAGNFADLLKHAVLTQLVRAMTSAGPPLTVIDTHAGAGLYDLDGGEARRTGEGKAGIGALMAATGVPPVFGDLKAIVERRNKPGALRFYPGSPLIIESRLRPRDRYIGCEFRADEFSVLQSALSQRPGAMLLKGDGWLLADKHAPKSPAPLLLLIDPPFERGDDADQATGLTRVVLKRNPGAVIAVWCPIKDLTSFDAITMALADAADPAPTVVAEVRLRPLSDPMRMNGCAMIVANSPPGLEEGFAQAAAWVAKSLGEPGGVGRVERIGPTV
jgi:23S rRNA (adenine2030-N6)-methyltransferase